MNTQRLLDEASALHDKIYDLLRKQLLLISKGAADTNRIWRLRNMLERSLARIQRRVSAVVRDK